MRLIHLAALLPLAIAAPAKQQQQESQSIPELSVSEWSSIQSTFVDGVRSLGAWSWSTAQDVIQEFDETKNGGEEGEDRTIWQQLKADPHSFSKIVKLIEVCSSLSALLCTVVLMSSLKVMLRMYWITRI
jgi:hypothetical protein